MQQYNKNTILKINEFADVTRENIKKHNPIWSHIPNHSHRILVTGGNLEKQMHHLI